jgi:general secretion pathway protein K
MILINVLVIVALAASILAIMLSGQDSHLERTMRLRAASQAMAILRGGELSAVAALRRDMVSGTVTDSLVEPWAKIADQDAAVYGGRFSYRLLDAQARFNINSLSQGSFGSDAAFAQIAAAAGLPGGATEQIVALLQVTGPIENLADLQVLGFDEAALRRLAEFCTVLPTPTEININTADERLIAVLLANSTAAKTLVQARERQGDLSQAALSSVAVALPAGVSFRSDYFWSIGEVTIGETRQRLTSLLRRGVIEGAPQVAAVRRWRGRPPVQVPTVQ